MNIKTPTSLRTRITLSFILLTALLLFIISVLITIGYETLEYYVFSEGLNSEAEWITTSVEHGVTLTLPEGRKLFDEMTVPEAYRHLSPGYHEIEISHTEEWHLLVFTVNDRHYFLMQDGSYYEKLETYIKILLAVIIFISLATALWVGRITAARVISPISRLTHAVEQNATPFPYQSASDEVGILSRAFSKHSEELQHYLQREQCFVGDASHELRTPLAIILGAAEIIDRDTKGTPELNQVASRIIRTAREMDEQLTTLLLLSRAPETIDTPDTDIVPIIQNAQERYLPLLDGKPVSVSFTHPDQVMVRGRPELIGSVIQNILHNACQYIERGEIHITLTADALTIQDTGPGLPASINLERFERFSHDTSEHGEGLGLSIVQRIVTHLGWRMKVSTGREGTSFTITFAQS